MVSPKICKGTQVINPRTGRCVSKTGKIGKEIMAKKKSQCSKNMIYNQDTGRCVLKTGVIGQKLLDKKSKSPKKKSKRCREGKYLN